MIKSIKSSIKKVLSVVLIGAMMFAMVACGSKEKGGGVSSDTTKMDMVLNPMEYTIYTNMYYNNKADDYDDKEYTKEGIFTILYDSYNDTERYYVWGYSDETKCCDWQWEFVPVNKESLPPVGSRIKVKGKLVNNEAALDNYWLVNTSVDVVKEYSKASCKYDLTTMDPTLTRVQLVNMMNFTDKYNGETVKIYARVLSNDKIQHPYYDNSWELKVAYEEGLPAIGSYITVEGKFTGTSASDCKLEILSLDKD